MRYELSSFFSRKKVRCRTHLPVGGDPRVAPARRPVAQRALPPQRGGLHGGGGRGGRGGRGGGDGGRRNNTLRGQVYYRQTGHHRLCEKKIASLFFSERGRGKRTELSMPVYRGRGRERERERERGAPHQFSHRASSSSPPPLFDPGSRSNPSLLPLSNEEGPPPPAHKS